MKKFILLVILCGINITSTFCLPDGKQPVQRTNDSGCCSNECFNCFKAYGAASCIALPCCCLGVNFGCKEPLCAAACCYLAVATFFRVPDDQLLRRSVEQWRKTEINNQMHRD